MLEQPVNGRLVRRAALLLIAPLLLLALTIGRPGPFPASALPPSFDGPSATALAGELARDYPDRAPGSAGALGAATWVKEQLGLFGLDTVEDRWDETIPGLGRVRLRNLVTVVPGGTPDAILVISHRDNIGIGPGANDNASGTAALIELARGYGRLGTIAGRPKPQHTLIFLSSDGGAFGGFGAERFASASPLRRPCPGRRLPRRAGGHRAASARAGRVLASFPGPCSRADGGRAGHCPARASTLPVPAGSPSSSISACLSATGSRLRSWDGRSRRSG